MPLNSTFDSILDEAEQLSVDEQETLVEILRHRLTEHHRNRVIQDVQSGREEFKRGECLPTTAESLLAELQP